MAFPPKSNALARAAAQPAPFKSPAPPSPAPLPPPAPKQMPQGMGDEAQSAQGNDVQVIMAAAQNDPVIAAIARVLGIG